MRMYMKTHTMRYVPLLLAVLMTPLFGFSQGDSSETYVSEAPSFTPALKLKPYVGLSLGTMMFIGEIGAHEGGHHVGSASQAYNISLSNDINDYLSIRLYSLFGTMTVNEQANARKFNFQSEVRSSGVSLMYDFANFYSRKRGFHPWVSVGFESFEFLSKTDLFDANGNRYHYWTDGSIRDMEETSPNKQDAVQLYRDYVYETDLRDLNTEERGSYNDRSWAIPIGAGVQWNCGDRFRVTAGTEMHFTLTDLVDNIADPEGITSADQRKDRFLFTSIGIAYDLNITPDPRKMYDLPEGIDPAVLAFAHEDEDMDGIMDFLDNCPSTPEGVEVNKQGCPLDEDEDGVPDYLDGEPNTPKGSEVDDEGFALGDDYFRQQWLCWTDSASCGATTQFAEIRTRLESDPAHWSNTYSVQVAPDDDGLTQAEINLLLSFKDVHMTQKDGEDVYLVGNYDELPDAVKRKMELEGQGIEGGVTKDSERGTMESMETLSANIEKELRAHIVPVDGFTEAGEFYRVQIGAYEDALSQNFFADIPDVISITGDDGLTRYSTRGYDSFEEAANRRLDLLQLGFQGSFVTAYSNGTRISLEEAGLTVAEGFEDITHDVAGNSSIAAEALSFTIELGVFNGSVETDLMNKFLELGDVRMEEDQDGGTHFVCGVYSDVSAAEEAAQIAIDSGIEGASVQGQFNGRLIPLQEALDLLGKNNPRTAGR